MVGIGKLCEDLAGGLEILKFENPYKERFPGVSFSATKTERHTAFKVTVRSYNSEISVFQEMHSIQDEINELENHHISDSQVVSIMNEADRAESEDILTLIFLIEHVMIQHYSKIGTNKVKGLYEPLLHLLSHYVDFLPVSTLNYDLSIDTLLKSTIRLPIKSGGMMINYDDGFRTSYFKLGAQEFHPAFLESFDLQKDFLNVIYLKLHGSVAWFEDDKGSHVIRFLSNPHLKVKELRDSMKRSLQPALMVLPIGLKS